MPRQVSIVEGQRAVEGAVRAARLTTDSARRAVGIVCVTALRQMLAIPGAIVLVVAQRAALSRVNAAIVSLVRAGGIHGTVQVRHLSSIYRVVVVGTGSVPGGRLQATTSRRWRSRSCGSRC